ncbi:hypothetical protein KKG22_02520 [Patescibacteria group bacterium]|nr:hypothetical protein [Patescibacteria group bacterium]MBU1722176.1 hypothetical protein [Patescibacteria group bacterium]MBU1901127.1 hypothetical protein [Patescibacteria group bacterium]
MEVKKHPNRRLLHIISTPFIYIVVVPMIMLDLFTEVYHRICFPIYHIPYIKRSKYIVFDRYRLSYLNIFDRVNCFYCSYANGFAAYFSAICGATEAYWCGIKHKEKKGFHQPSHHEKFMNYGDKCAFEKNIPSRKK